MPTLLLTVRQIVADSVGLRLSPGIRPSEMEDRPAIGKMIQGSRLELRCPNGVIRTTTLLTYGVSLWEGENGTLRLYDDPRNPEICLTLPPELHEEEVPPGTEVWLMDDQES